MGWEASFHLYILCAIPLLYYVDQWSLPFRGAASVSILIVYVGLAIASDRIGAQEPIVAQAHLEIARYGNMAIAAAVLIALSAFYQSAVARAERYMEHYSDTLQHISLSDPLTAVFNRRGTEMQLDVGISNADRQHLPIAVALLDLDHFKAVNDRYGHEIGDELLKSVASAAASVVRDSDSFGRWGGEEFLAILPNTDESGARLVTERIVDAITSIALRSPSGETITITATIGVAIHTADDGPLSDARTQLVRKADEALYRGKTAGRNRVVFADSKVGT